MEIFEAHDVPEHLWLVILEGLESITYGSALFAASARLYVARFPSIDGERFPRFARAMTTNRRAPDHLFVAAVRAVLGRRVRRAARSRWNGDSRAPDRSLHHPWSARVPPPSRLTVARAVSRWRGGRADGDDLERAEPASRSSTPTARPRPRSTRPRSPVWRRSSTGRARRARLAGGRRRGVLADLDAACCHRPRPPCDRHGRRARASAWRCCRSRLSDRARSHRPSRRASGRCRPATSPSTTPRRPADEAASDALRPRHPVGDGERRRGRSR